jgi:hypothetical protein
MEASSKTQGALHGDSRSPNSPLQPGGLEASSWLEWGVTVSSAWFIAGVYVDAWAHIRHLPEGFFTPWHAIIYSGWLAAALILGIAWISGRRRGYGSAMALPMGYGLSLLGAGVFFLAGAGDLAWHIVFGIETDIEALYSPPHILLACGGALIASGPLRSAWTCGRTDAATRWRAVASLTFLLAILTFFTSESHPFVHPWAWIRFRPTAMDPANLGLPSMPAGGVGPQDLALTVGIGSFLIQTVVLSALLLLAIRRWGALLPLGWLTFALTTNAVGLSIFHSTPWTIPVAALGGVASDLLYRLLRPDVKMPVRVRLFGASVPAVLSALYFASISIRGGIWWSIHAWAGAIILTSLAGWHMTYLVIPPPMPQERNEGNEQDEAWNTLARERLRNLAR